MKVRMPNAMSIVAGVMTGNVGGLRGCGGADCS